ncbi:hypothetical protein O3M35_004933 [Rhynocoris fuscipes]|uniref:Poly(A) polymerase nucleotidyltransferase domain-containing protein n=1 Tax=Rhynocoris fuscipes TaxID=488301 RepID=A0AAW1DH84_9HEMI
MWSSQQGSTHQTQAPQSTQQTNTVQQQQAQLQQPQPSQQQQQARTLGLTSAITLAGPKPIDILRTNELLEALKPYNVMESEEELNHSFKLYYWRKICKEILTYEIVSTNVN